SYLGDLALDEAARVSGGRLAGLSEPSRAVVGLAPIDAPVVGAAVYAEKLAQCDGLTDAGVALCVTKPEFEAELGHLPLLLTDEPRAAFARISSKLYAAIDWSEGEAVSPHAQLGEDVSVGAGAVVSAGAAVGPRTRLGPGCIIGPGVQIGADGWIEPGVILSHTLAGDGVRLLRGAMIGQDGFGFAVTKQGLVRVPQLGRVILQDDVEIGACTTVDRGALGDTVIGAGAKIDNQVQIGHNVWIGRGCVIAAQCGISGSAVIEDFAMLGGKVGVADHVRIGRGAQIAAGSGLMRDIPAGERWGGYPARTAKAWMRETAWLARASRGKGTHKENKDA
ncbi:MAG: UDP-3-O-(3-hydroxymyristoyl)glucosamine N-acyltransferase, partial [Pseudomonadota bacterium]